MVKANAGFAHDSRAEYVALRIEDERSNGTESLEDIVARSCRIMDIAEYLPSAEIDRLEAIIRAEVGT